MIEKKMDTDEVEATQLTERNGADKEETQTCTQCVVCLGILQKFTDTDFLQKVSLIGGQQLHVVVYRYIAHCSMDSIVVIHVYSVLGL